MISIVFDNARVCVVGIVSIILDNARLRMVGISSTVFNNAKAHVVGMISIVFDNARLRVVGIISIEDLYFFASYCSKPFLFSCYSGCALTALAHSDQMPLLLKSASNNVPSIRGAI
jgi:hypothetical protein